MDAGYRLIDTASAYGNEEGVGKAIAASGIPREEIFVTTKLRNEDHGRRLPRWALDASLKKLGLDFVDLYLIHWPLPKRNRYVETWQALEKLNAEGRTRAIGVSNFTEHQLNRLRRETSIVPAVNQVELHPRWPQTDLRVYHDEHRIVTEAWSPIGQGQGLLEDPAVLSVAESHDRTPAQVVLRWHLQLGNVAIPKSTNPDRIKANIEILDFELNAQEMATLSSLQPTARIGPDPDTLGVGRRERLLAACARVMQAAPRRA